MGRSIAWAAGTEIPPSPTARLFGVGEPPYERTPAQIVLGTGHFGNPSPRTLPGRGLAVDTQAVVDDDGDGS
jgi:hypothetical protein